MQTSLVEQEAPQEVQPLAAPQQNFDEVLHARQSGAKDKQEDFGQRVKNPAAFARIAQRREMVEQRGDAKTDIERRERPFNTFPLIYARVD